MTKRLPSEIKSAINKTAHAIGLKHGETIRRQLMADAEAMLTAGKSVPEIVAHLADATANRKDRDD